MAQFTVFIVNPQTCKVLTQIHRYAADRAQAIEVTARRHPRLTAQGYTFKVANGLHNPFLKRYNSYLAAGNF